MHGESIGAVGFIGAGKVGLVLATAVHEAGIDVAGIWDAVPSAAERIPQDLRGAWVTDLSDLVSGSAVIVVAVPDDVIPRVVGTLADTTDLAGKLVLHTSGRCGLGVLEPARRAGASVLAMHPAMAFTGAIDQEARRLRGTKFGLTSLDGSGQVGAALVTAIGGSPFTLRNEDRVLYHAAMSHGSNHLATLVTQTIDLIEHAGVDDPIAALRPILEASLENALQHRARGITGPVVRGDIGTVREHLEVLSQRAPELRPSYVAMSLATVAAVSDAEVLDPTAAAEFRELLGAGTGRDDDQPEHDIRDSETLDGS